MASTYAVLEKPPPHSNTPHRTIEPPRHILEGVGLLWATVNKLKLCFPASCLPVRLGLAVWVTLTSTMSSNALFSASFVRPMPITPSTSTQPSRLASVISPKVMAVDMPPTLSTSTERIPAVVVMACSFELEEEREV